MLETLMTLVVWGFLLGFGFTAGAASARCVWAALRYLFTGQIG